MAYNLDILRVRGDTKRLIMTLYNPNTGAVQSISGWTTFKLGIDTLSAPPDATTNVATLNGSLLTDGTDGKVSFTVPNTIPIGNYFFDAQAVDANSEVYTFARGQFIVEQDRTK